MKLNQFEAEWSKQENLTVEQLQEALRREDTEYKAKHSNEEQLAMVRRDLYERYPHQYFGVDQ